MSAPVNSLNSVRRQETPLPSAQSNKLPHIDDMKEAAANRAKAYAVLLEIIAAYGLVGTFSLHLFHKHFDVPEGRINMYETIKKQGS